MGDSRSGHGVRAGMGVGDDSGCRDKMRIEVKGEPQWV